MGALAQSQNRIQLWFFMSDVGCEIIGWWCEMKRNEEKRREMKRNEEK
jgi:hypothetical protein